MVIILTTWQDGEWEAPLIDNPAYKGPWKAKTIPNPDYKGEWEHPEIPNPDYKDDKELYLRCKDCKYIGFELWQVKAGTVFDDIIVTDSLAEATAYAQSTFVKNKEAEAKALEAYEKANQPEAPPASPTGGEDEDDEEEEDDEDGNDEL